MTSADYRYVAREALRGRWPISVAVTFVAILLGAGTGSSGSNGSNGGSGNSARETYDAAAGSGIFQYGFSLDRFLAIFIGMLSVVALAIFIGRFIIGSSIDLGLRLYNIRMVMKYDQQAFTSLFERFTIFGRALGLRLLMNLFIFLWSLLFVIPGIIAAYRYAMAPYLMAQYPEMGIMEAMDRSKELMYGHKAELFFLHLSFIGWILLSSITLGIGFLILNPYQNAAETAFYLDKTNQLPIHRPV